MPHPIQTFGVVAICATLIGAPLAAQTPVEATAEFVGLEGQSHGAATLTQAPIGVLIQAELTGVPEGSMGFHIHEVGVCEPPFESAGSHFNPSDAPHGYLVEGGPEAGDLPNVQAPASGEVTVEMFTSLVSLQDDAENSLFDTDGSALVLHSQADDYATQPSGNAGDPIACAVITQ